MWIKSAALNRELKIINLKNMFTSIQNFILFIIWPLLILFSAIIFIKGVSVYKLVKGSLLGKITKSLVYTILVDISSLGIISTVYLFSKPEGFYLVLAVFVVWFIVFIWSIKILSSAKKEADKIAGGANYPAGGKK